jgi:hypothetical protein
MTNDEVFELWLELAVEFMMEGNNRWATFCKQQAVEALN